MSMQDPDIIVEAKRLVTQAETQQLSLRLLGGIAVHIHCPGATAHPLLVRDYKDIDVVAPQKSRSMVSKFFITQQYQPDQNFNALHGASRLLYYDTKHERQVDIFLGTFSMCHKLNLEPRIPLSTIALPPSDLLLLKLQIIELNKKDITDALTLLLQHEPVQEDRGDTLSLSYIAKLCAGDWGWFTTLHDNLKTLQRAAPDYLQDAQEVALTQARAERLLAALQDAPKSMSWKLRDKIGRRMTWYELPEEVAG